MAEPLVTVVIPNYNGMKFLPHLMKSLAEQTDSRFSIVVVDDTSTDDSTAYLKEKWPRVRLMCNERNLGFAASCNRGLRAATTPLVALLNNDTHVDPNWLSEAVRAFDHHTIGSVASLVLLADPPHRVDTAGDVYSVAGGALKRHHLQPRETIAGLDASCTSASGASAFFRREAVAAVGYLDERFESYYEDVDLGLRLAWAGHRCRFAPKSICYHHLSASYHPKGWRYHFNSARNAEIVWWSHLPAKLRRRFLLSHLCFLVLQSGNKLRQGCLRPYLAGKWAALAHRRHILEKRMANDTWNAGGGETIESLLVRDWWRLHVASRWKAPQPGARQP
ncbi:MAG: glycosyltransferase family 2 protein [Phycisphaerae bacterium]